jgi:hypothetical protein
LGGWWTGPFVLLGLSGLMCGGGLPSPWACGRRRPLPPPRGLPSPFCMRTPKQEATQGPHTKRRGWSCAFSTKAKAGPKGFSSLSLQAKGRGGGSLGGWGRGGQAGLGDVAANRLKSPSNPAFPPIGTFVTYHKCPMEGHYLLCHLLGLCPSIAHWRFSLLRFPIELSSLPPLDNRPRMPYNLSRRWSK